MIGLVFLGYVAISATIMITIVGSAFNENSKKNKIEKNLYGLPIERKNQKDDIQYNVQYILNQKNENSKKEQNKTQYYNINYDPKRYIKKNNEMKFYYALLDVANKMDLIVFSKAVLKNIFQGKMSSFNKMSSKDSIFVLVRIKDCQVAACVDLNSPKLDINKNKKSEFLDLLFYEYGINLVKYPVLKDYDKETLKSILEENMNNENN